MKRKIRGLLAVGLLAWLLAVQAAVIDFDGIPDGHRVCYGGTCNFTYLLIDYVEDEFQLTAPLTSWDSDNLNFNGSRSLAIFFSRVPRP